MFLADELILDAPRRTKEGYLAVRAKAARAGVYDYQGREIDPEGKHFAADEMVKVYRPEDEVFAKDAVRSFLLKPITDNHPSVAVTAANWKDHAKGVNAGALRDGEYLAFDLVLMDAGTIAAVESGKKELSNGYQCEIEIGDGTAPDGTAFQATQRAIRGNHVAVVKKGRAGPECRIGDAACCDQIPPELLSRLLGDERTYQPADDSATLQPARRETSNFEEGSRMATKTIQFDGLPVEVTDAAEAVIRKLEGQITTLTDAKAKSDEKSGELAATISTKDGEIKALEAKLADAEVSPDKLEKMVADRSTLVTTAKAIVPTIICDGKTEAQIRREVVDAKCEDVADAEVMGAFKVLARDVKPADPVRDAIRDQARTTNDGADDLQSARAQWLADKQTAYRNKAA